jgi:hypothetical protein
MVCCHLIQAVLLECHVPRLVMQAHSPSTLPIYLVHTCVILYCRQWSLNWNEIDDKILIGSCPRSTQDVVRSTHLLVFTRFQHNKYAHDALFCHDPWCRRVIWRRLLLDAEKRVHTNPADMSHDDKAPRPVYNLPLFYSSRFEVLA